VRTELRDDSHQVVLEAEASDGVSVEDLRESVRDTGIELKRRIADAWAPPPVVTSTTVDAVVNRPAKSRVRGRGLIIAGGVVIGGGVLFLAMGGGLAASASGSSSCFGCPSTSGLGTALMVFGGVAAVVGVPLLVSGLILHAVTARVSVVPGGLTMTGTF
jgi:hypothetical protein